MLVWQQEGHLDSKSSVPNYNTIQQKLVSRTVVDYLVESEAAVLLANFV